MRVLITGGAGLIGKAIASHLQDCSWDVFLIDIVAETEFPDSMYAVCDIMDFDGLRKRMRGCDAVVHMAALKNPLYGPGQDVFRINTAGTFNVFEAAAREGIRRVVQASSINAIGCGWNIGDFVPRYFPVDEDHPSITYDAYSFSKRQIEEIGDYYWRRDGITSVALRFPGVLHEGVAESPQFYERRATMHRFLDELVALPEAEQSRLLADVRQRCIAYRAQRPLEYPSEWPKSSASTDFDTLLWRAYAFDRYHMWATLDERDAARSVERALTADIEGSYALFVNNLHNSLDYDSRTLARLFFPDTHEWKREVAGSKSLVSADRAHALIGFEPRHSPHRDHDA